MTALFSNSKVEVLGSTASKRPLALALQGGGSFGAFTWGVLDNLLTQDIFSIDTVSGASAGAVNAVVLADGLAEGGVHNARKRLERFWKRVSDAGALMPFGYAASTSAALDLSTRIISPYQFNPLGLDPLRDILIEEIDFERVRSNASVQLLIAATRVRDGRPRLFRNAEITLESVLASACMPFFHQAVEIEGESYWDGGYSANPPLRELVAQSHASDLMLVLLIPDESKDVPRLAPDIARRVSQIAFNSSLQRELDALGDLIELCSDQGPSASHFCRRLQRLRIHRIARERAVDGLRAESAFNLDWPFLTKLKQHGNDAVDDWLNQRLPLNCRY